MTELIYQNYCNFSAYDNKLAAVARILTIYINEAHPIDEWWLKDSKEAGIGEKRCLLAHQTIEDRIIAAKKLDNDLAVWGR